MSEPVVALVVAAGSGVRLGDSTAGGSGPKALRRLAGLPLVRRSVDALAMGGVERVIVVISPAFRPDFDAALAGVAVPVDYAAGGASRQESVRNGLAALGDDAGIVLIHDAARPLVPAEVTRRVVDAVRAGAEAVVPVVPVTDSIRRVTADGSVVVDRAPLRAVQTPQGFRRDVIVAAHAATAGDGREYTDDAAVCEACGHHVTLVPGARDAMKITEPLDFAIAESVLALQEG